MHINVMGKVNATTRYRFQPFGASLWEHPGTSNIYHTSQCTIWHRAVFNVGLARPKIPSAPSAFPLLGAPQAPGKNLSPKGVKAWWDGPLRPKEISSTAAHLAEPSRGRTAYQMRPNNWRGKVVNILKECPGTSTICQCLPPDKAWHKVKSPKAD